MAKKITIQHWYTTTGTTAPAGLIEGEIAISHSKGQEAIFIKPDENDNQIKFIPKHQIENLITTKLGEAGVATEGIISALTTNLENHINNDIAKASELGHVKLVGGDLSGKTGNVTNGEAAASHHSHSQYIAKDDISNGLEMWSKGLGGGKEMLRVKAAPNGGIIVDASGVSINAEIIKAKDAINAFLNDAKLTGNTVDTLKEIQQFLDGTGSTVQTLLDNLSDLTDTVSVNTSEIESLKSNQSNFVTSISGDNKNLLIFNDATNRYTIAHTSASTQNSAITATNDITGLSFGSEFKIVNNIGYDANGHVVSGSTQTMKLPIISLRGGLTGTTGTDANGTSGYIIGHKNSFNAWNGKSTGITLNFDEGFKIPIIDYEEQDGRDPNLSGVDETGHLKNNRWTLTTFSLPNIISCGTY